MVFNITIIIYNIVIAIDAQKSFRAAPNQCQQQQSVKRLERSNGVNTALYKTYLYLLSAVVPGRVGDSDNAVHRPICPAGTRDDAAGRHGRNPLLHHTQSRKNRTPVGKTIIESQS